MQNNKIARRRGTSVAAAALSFALVAPMAQPVAFAQDADGATDTTVTDGAPEADPTADEATPKEYAPQTNDAPDYPGFNDKGVYQTSVNAQRYVFENQEIVGNAIESPAKQDDKNSIQGYVVNNRNGRILTGPNTGGDLRAVPMQGVRVYAQFIDTQGDVSPVYTTTTNSDGRYAIKIPEFFDMLGGEHEFNANPQSPSNERVRIWADNPDPDTFQQLYGPFQGKTGPESTSESIKTTVLDTTAGMGWRTMSKDQRLENANFHYGEKPQNKAMHRDKAEPVPAAGNQGTVSGKAFWNLHEPKGGLYWTNQKNYHTADVPAEGMTVYGSYLSDYAVNKIENEAPAALGVGEIRGRDWNRDKEAALQNWIKLQIAEEGKDKWIAETVSTQVDSNGDYKLQFKGTFGTDHKGDRGSQARPRNPLFHPGEMVAFPDGSQHEAYNLVGTVAPAADYATFSHAETGILPDRISSIPKHVNWDWLFVSTEDVTGAAVMTPFNTNAYLNVNKYQGDHWGPRFVKGANAGRVVDHGIAMYPDHPLFDVTPYNSQSNFARPGDVAETRTSGLPSQFVNGLQYQIEWVNQNTGEKTTSELFTPDGNTRIPSFPMDTTGVTETTKYVANLYAVNVKDPQNPVRGDRIASDSFVVLVGYAPIYEDQVGLPGDELVAPAPLFDNTETDEVEQIPGDSDQLPSKVKEYKLAPGFNNPTFYNPETDETVEIVPVVDPKTGEVTAKIPGNAPRGIEFTVPVVATFENDTQATGQATFTVPEDTETDADKHAPKGKDQPVKKGESADPKNNIVDPEKLPEGTKFEYKDGNAPDTSKPGKQDVVVVVTYPDGSTDEVKTTVTVTDPNAGNTGDKKQADQFDPKGKDQPVKKGETADPKNNIVDPEKLPEGTKFEYKDGNAPDTSKPGKQDVVVVVTYPDGSTDEVKTTVTVDKVAPVNDNVIVPADGQDHIVGTVTDPSGNETAKVVDKDGNEVPDITAEVDKNGNVIVNVPEDTKPGEYTVEVYDGDDKIGEITFYVPGYGDATEVKPGESENTANPFGNRKPALNSVKLDDDQKGGWTFTPDQTSGVITGKAPTEDELKGLFNEAFPIGVPGEGDKQWTNFETGFKDTGAPEVEASFDFTDPKTKDSKAAAGFTLIGQDGKSIFDKTGDFDGDGISNEQEIKDGTNPFDETSNKVSIDESGKKPVVKGKNQDQDTGVKVRLPKDVKVTEVTAVDEDGNDVKVTVDADGKLRVNPDVDRNGKKIDVDGPITVTVKDSKGGTNTVEIDVVDQNGKQHVKNKDDNGKGANANISNDGEIDVAKCAASSVGFGLPLIALIPLGLASQVAIPGITPVVDQVRFQLEQVNAGIQQQLGIFNPQIAGQVAEINAQLRGFGADIATVGAGLFLIAAGILSGTLIYDACTPENKGLSSKVSAENVEVKGSSGKTYVESSKK